MRILEILLPKGTSDKSLSPQQARKIDTLQQRMDVYVDKIMSPGTSAAGKEFLKTKLRSDYKELKDEISRVMEQHPELSSPADTSTVQYEIYDKRTSKKVVNRGPYSSKSRARSAVDKLDNKFGAYRYGYRPVGKITEAINRLPLTTEDFNVVKKMMEKPIPAVIAPIYIMEIIEDDELNDQLSSLEETEPNRDVRPLVMEWLKRIMPDQMYRFGQEVPSDTLKKGLLSPIHGYDSKSYKL
jgi:hypothetical protein